MARSPVLRHSAGPAGVREAAERRHQRLVAVHVHPVRAHQSRPRALLGPVANATDVMGVLEADDCNAVLLGPLDAWGPWLRDGQATRRARSTGTDTET
jgi:hypothetical protein